MLIQRTINKKIYAVEIGEPLHKQAYETDFGIIEFALVKPYSDLSKYDIVEVSTGTMFVPNVGKLKETSFVNICTAFIFLGAKKLKSRIDESKKIKDFPLWKENATSL